MYWFFHLNKLIFYYRCVEIRASLCDWHVYTQGIHIYVIALSVREIPPFSFLRGVSRAFVVLVEFESSKHGCSFSTTRARRQRRLFFVGERKEMHVRRVTDLFVRSRIGRDKRPIY